MSRTSRWLNYRKPQNVKITTVDEIDNSGRPRTTVTIETVDPDKEKRERNERISKILLYILLCLAGVGLIVYHILHAFGLV